MSANLPDPTEGHDLSGPWEGILVSRRDGYLFGTGDSLEFEEDLEVSVVRRSALPVDDGDGFRRVPDGPVNGADVLFTIDGFGDDEDVWFRLALAQRIARLLNADDQATADARRTENGETR